MAALRLCYQALGDDLASYTRERVTVQYFARAQGFDSLVYEDAAVLVCVLRSVYLPMAPQDVHASLDVDGSPLLDQPLEQRVEEAGQWVHGPWHGMHLARLVHHQWCRTSLHTLGKSISRDSLDTDFVAIFFFDMLTFLLPIVGHA